MSEATRALGADATPLLEVRDLRVHYRRGVPAVDGLTLTVRAGERLAIIGESGSGKTTAARALLGLLPQSAAVNGSVRVAGRELLGSSERQLRQYRGRQIAMVFQDTARSLNPTMRIGDQIAEVVRCHERNVSRRDARYRAVELLRRLELDSADERFFAYPHQLSGGMRQRALIAIALAGSPRLLIADEATRSLDAATQVQVMVLLTELTTDLGMGLIMISHDLGLAAGFADRILVMHAGRAIEYGSAGTLLESPRMPYTRALRDALAYLESSLPVREAPV